MQGPLKRFSLYKPDSDQQTIESDLMAFLVYYIIYRRHGSLKREPGVKTPCEAFEKCLPRSKGYRGYELKPEIFTENSLQFKNKVINLVYKSSGKARTF